MQAACERDGGGKGELGLHVCLQVPPFHSAGKSINTLSMAQVHAAADARMPSPDKTPMLRYTDWKPQQVALACRSCSQHG